MFAEVHMVVVKCAIVCIFVGAVVVANTSSDVRLQTLRMTKKRSPEHKVIPILAPLLAPLRVIVRIVRDALGTTRIDAIAGEVMPVSLRVSYPSWVRCLWFVGRWTDTGDDWRYRIGEREPDRTFDDLFLGHCIAVLNRLRRPFESLPREGQVFVALTRDNIDAEVALGHQIIVKSCNNADALHISHSFDRATHQRCRDKTLVSWLDGDQHLVINKNGWRRRTSSYLEIDIVRVLLITKA